MAEEYTIAESYTLPSKGLVYEKPVNPKVTLRSMTVEEEMKRLAPSELPYKVLAEIIDDCLIKEKPGISVYDMYIGDYEFLLHKLREVTYGSDYKVSSVCPYCNKANKSTIDLSKIRTIEYSGDIEKDLNIVLPSSGKHIKLKLQTPRMLDDIKVKSDDQKRRMPNLKSEPAILFSLMSMIEKVDNQDMNDVELEDMIRKLPLKDINYLYQKANKVDFGVEKDVECKCQHCGENYTFSFPFTSEFFWPEIDE